MRLFGVVPPLRPCIVAGADGVLHAVFRELAIASSLLLNDVESADVH